ncbi:MAG: pyruvate ferredoxin oxidoreductase [Euryarchaeota archaeon CG01_land_8_20_14_3_00_38_12]|nr:MAG: pyruvate ferredoxin oxidoreductase [Euryarchaeota archaeon CG01_land_8_20_14_3_00_38_12]PJB22004.1 MAG: pyruvate ferredoxin oxidoreductase [Euryarchaeota archaeon CG_4_9_14_3_um_filter_38_12]
MIEIRFHGRGGQGAVTAANILADACFKEGKDVQSFPFFGVERRGAPVTAFTRIDSKPIRIKYQIYEPDFVVVLDSGLMKTVNVLEGLKKNGLVLINMAKNPDEIKMKESLVRVATVDATGIALKHKLGSRMAPIINTAILGAFAKASNVVKIATIMESIKEIAPARKEENADAAKEAYENVMM